MAALARRQHSPLCIQPLPLQCLLLRCCLCITCILLPCPAPIVLQLPPSVLRPCAFLDPASGRHLGSRRRRRHPCRRHPRRLPSIPWRCAGRARLATAPAQTPRCAAPSGERCYSRFIQQFIHQGSCSSKVASMGLRMLWLWLSNSCLGKFAAWPPLQCCLPLTPLLPSLTPPFPDFPLCRGFCGTGYAWCSSDKNYCMGGPCKDYSDRPIAQVGRGVVPGKALRWCCGCMLSQTLQLTVAVAHQLAAMLWCCCTPRQPS